MTDLARLRRARAGVFGTFFLLGFSVATWATNLPTIQQRTGIGTAAIGIVILAMGVGTLAGAQLCGHLVDRIGGRTTSLLGVVVLLAAVNCLPLAHDGWTLGLIAVFQGFGSGCTDVAMNSQAVIVERGYRRPIMSAFHALFSVGGAAGAGLAALLQAAGTSYPLILAAFTAVCAVIGTLSLPAMLPGRPPATRVGQHAADGGAVPPIGGRIALLGTLAFLLMLSEGTAGSWGALHAVHQLHVTDAAASLAYGVFSTCMTVGRLLVDRAVAAIGPVAMVRVGGAIAAAGMLVVIVSHAYPLTLLGWAVCGIGLAGGVPQVFSAAGNLPSARPGAAMARVFGLGYAGELGGPAIIGGASAVVSIGLAFVIPFAFCVASIGLAFGVRPDAPPATAGTTPRAAGATPRDRAGG